MAYYYIAETNLSYLQKDGKQKWPTYALRGLILAATYFGTVRTAELAWTLGDIGVGLMAWLNVIAILLLRKPALEALKDFKAQKDAGKDPTYDFEAMKENYSKNKKVLIK
jgi:AGCS family alanine or glycine:cation symporter